MKRAMIALLILLPISSVAFCVILFVLAANGATDILPSPAKPLSKTSWQQVEP